MIRYEQDPELTARYLAETTEATGDDRFRDHAGADFYVGRGDKAEYLGSVVSSGHPLELGMLHHNSGRTTVFNLQHLVTREFAEADFRAHVTAMGHYVPDWPWSHAQSHDTEWTYAYDSGTVYVYYLGVEMLALRCNWGRSGPRGTRVPRDITTVFPSPRKDRS